MNEIWNEKWNRLELLCRQMLADGENWDSVFSLIKDNEFGILYSINFYRNQTGKTLGEAIDFVGNSQFYKNNPATGISS